MSAQRARTTPDTARELQRTLYRAAKASPTRRFHALYDKMYREDVLAKAWQEVKANAGSAGVDGQTIEQIEQKQIGATLLPFYTLRLAANNSLVLVPVSNASEVGLRAPISSGECEMLLKALADDFTSPANDWKDRFKEFSEKMRTGDIFEVADVLKHLTYLSNLKPLSFREQRMLERSRYLVVSELAAVCRQPECNIEPRVDQAIARACTKHDRRPARTRAAGAASGH